LDVDARLTGKTETTALMESGDNGVSIADRKTNGEAETGKDSYNESIALEARALKKACESGVRTERYEDFGTPKSTMQAKAESRKV